MLKTERLILRGWESDDFDAFKAIATDPRVMQYIGTGESWSDERIQQFFEANTTSQREAGFSFWAVIDSETQTLIGLCGLFRFDGFNEVEIGWWLTPDYWGKGLAIEAAQAVMAYGFEQLNLPRIVAIAQPENQRSIRVMEKLGMQFEKMTVDRRGIDVVYYAKNNPLSLP
ncbi:GNAT family N-acetyltransferase [Oscillatoria sp. FACHB-1407]|uniref:GNAT family N-acetyltransferase n=1 Tax=Oscillatoria sp. FACHB-1407 TaxID=2692847 RepID=UPI0016890C1C|nr:GNAT family N-acetyltransferase [Oscillatoria sp. FACHB-1407]MBD2460707.1 GNAT family N-acetyltransferase [Oscillatoria sp. FACHB-1407]